MVGQDREEANRLQQAKWELTSRIRDESNVPNAFHFSRRSRKRYNAETVPQAGTASQGTILCKVARNSVNRRCPMTIRVRAADSFGVFRGITDDSDCGERARQLCRSGVKEGCASRVSA